MIVLEVVEGGAEAARNVIHGGVLLRGQLVDVLVNRGRRLNLVLDAIQTCQQQGGEGHVRVRRGIGAAELDTLGLRVWTGDRDTHAGGAVALRVHQVDRGLEARNETVVGVGRRVGEGQQRRGVLEDAADVVTSHVG